MSAPKLHPIDAQCTLAASAWSRRLRFEEAIAAAVLLKPSLANVAREAGFDIDLMSDPAFRIIFVAAEHKADSPDDAVPFAQLVLDHGGYPARAWDGVWWRNLLDRAYPSTTHVQYAVQQLRSIAQRIETAERHQAYSTHVLRDVATEVEPVQFFRVGAP